MTSLGDSRAFAKRAWKARQAAKRRQFFPTMQTFVNMMEWSITSSSFRGLTTSSTFSTLKHTHISISKNYIHHIRFTSKGTAFVICGKLCDGAMIFNSLQMSINNDLLNLTKVWYVHNKNNLLYYCLALNYQNSPINLLNKCSFINDK